MSLNLNIIANTIIEPGMSGGNRIFIECARRWAKQGIAIRIFTSSVGKELCEKNGLNDVDYVVWSVPYSKARLTRVEAFVFYIIGTLRGCIIALRTSCSESKVLIYSSSDFWPDSIPAFIMKLKNRGIKWIAGFYLFAPEPWQKDSCYKGKRFSIGLFYYLTQLPIYWIVKRYADMVFVTSEPDLRKFVTRKRNRGKIVVIRGGVDIQRSTEYLSLGKAVPKDGRKYDACFVGRFHYQKGVLELIDIWKLVCKEKPKAKLAMIGIGPLEADVKNRIASLGLSSNIELLSFKDGEEKHEIFKQSKIVIHPATYDSGGMAACEAMAWGLPGVSFDLEALKTYYPKGMLKTRCYDLEAFARNILTLLEDEKLYEKLKKDAIDWAKEWDWDKRAEEVWGTLQAQLFSGKL